MQTKKQPGKGAGTGGDQGADKHWVGQYNKIRVIGINYFLCILLEDNLGEIVNKRDIFTIKLVLDQSLYLNHYLFFICIKQHGWMTIKLLFSIIK